MSDKGGIPKRLSQASAVKLLRATDWVQTLGGKHNVKMTKTGMRPITLPHHGGKEYGVSLTMAILKQAGLKTTTSDDDVSTEETPREATNQ